MDAIAKAMDDFAFSAWIERADKGNKQVDDFEKNSFDRWLRS